MNSKIIASLSAAFLFAAGCATVEPPKELVAARAQYETAMKTQTAQQNPAGLYDAKKALDVANQAYSEDPEGQETKDFAYLALRKVELANAKAASELAMAQKTQLTNSRIKQTEQSLTAAQKALEAQKGEMKDRERMTAEEIRKRDEALAKQNETLVKTTADLEKEKAARAEAEKKAQASADELARIAATKREARGIVLTLSGAVLFTSNQATLLAGARTKLDEVATALQKAESSGFVVEGHTDSVGSDATNQSLSERRAQSVRDYLVSKGVPSEDITSVGYGKTRPIADNTSAEGRANNRRVEIVIKPPASLSNR